MDKNLFLSIILTIEEIMQEGKMEDLFQELLKRNRHNQQAISAFLKQNRRNLKKNIQCQQQQNYAPSQIPCVLIRKQKRIFEKAPFNSYVVTPLDHSLGKDKENDMVNSTIQSRISKKDIKTRYRVTRQMKVNCFMRRSKEARRGQKSASQNKTPLYLKNIIFQASSTLKYVRNSEHYRSFYRKHLLPAQLPFFFAQRCSVNYSEASASLLGHS